MVRVVRSVMGTTKPTDSPAPPHSSINPELVLQCVVAGAIIFALIVGVLVAALVMSTNDANRTAREAVEKCMRIDR